MARRVFALVAAGIFEIGLAQGDAPAVRPLFCPPLRIGPDGCQSARPASCRVALALQIQRDGSTAAVQIKKSSGYRQCDQSAIGAVQQWKYPPQAQPTPALAKIDSAYCSAGPRAQPTEPSCGQPLSEHQFSLAPFP